MYSLNVPVPGRVARLAADLRPALTGFDRLRDDLTLVVKRLGSPEPHEIPHVNERVRAALAGLPPFEVQVTGLDRFDAPARGAGPVVYLAVASPGLVDAHRRLVDAFQAAEGIEGDDYVPHVTLARGGDPALADRLCAREVDPVTWTVTELVFWDHGHGGRAGSIRLPA